MVGGDGGRDLLHHDRLARLGGRDDQRALALALRRHEIEDAAGDVFAGAVTALELEALAREQRGEVLEQGLVLRSFQRLAVDRSEEHTSELQSLMRISYAVFCLKKK